MYYKVVLLIVVLPHIPTTEYNSSSTIRYHFDIVSYLPFPDSLNMAYTVILAAMAAVVAAAVADAGSYDGQAYDTKPAAYDDLLLQDLYKRLSLMTDNEDGSYSNAAGAGGIWSANHQENGDVATLVANDAFPTPGSEDESLKERLRDHEYLEHSSLFSEDGFNYLPGSTAWSK